MTRYFFLPSSVFFLMVGVWIYVAFNLGIGYLLLESILFGLVFFGSRRKNVPFRETAKKDGEIYLAPVNGEVRSIRPNVNVVGMPHLFYEVRISIPAWNEKGLYLPTTGEVVFLKATKGRKIPRESDSQAFYGPVDEVAHTDCVVASRNKLQTLLRFIDCKYGNRPTIFLKLGDRGRGAACFGYYPFGGTLLIYLPENSDILVFENEKLVAGQSVIAALKDRRNVV